jgi:hypothetical protein
VLQQPDPYHHKVGRLYRTADEDTTGNTRARAGPGDDERW